jgi:hypothetical protein
MDIKSITEIVNSSGSDELKEKMIISILSRDKKIIPTILQILQSERLSKDELILDSNAELSRALVVLKDNNLKSNRKVIADPKWVSGEIIKHYQKWKDFIACNFKIKELE